MAQATAIVIKNNAAVDVTFNPEAIAPALSTYVDRSTGVSAQFPRMSIRYQPAGGSRKSTKTSLKIALPSFGTLPSGAVGILRTARATVDFDFDDGTTDAERKDMYAFIKNALAHALVTGALRDHDPLY